ncbi:MAG: biotin--[acetyl-CoA-carboxylase] ligase, partial [Candidatus Omnitrophota bacterium]
LSGEHISEVLKVTRAAVWKHMEKFRAVGYDIEAVPHLGYRLKSIPDKLLPDEITAGLKAGVFGREIYAYESTKSTNDIAYGLAEKGAAEGAVVIAEKQERGRGRLGRKWISPSGGVYMSCVIKPDILPREIQEFTLVTALALCDAIRIVTGLKPGVKWPNDVYINGKKVCGILTEMKAETDRIDFVIVGIGVNVNTGQGMLPDTATSLKKEKGCHVSRIDIARQILMELESKYFLFRRDGFQGMRKAIKALSCTIGNRVEVATHNSRYAGLAEDIDNEGALIVKMPGGECRRVLSGDVTLKGGV